MTAEAAAAADGIDHLHRRVWRAQLLRICIWSWCKNLSLVLAPRCKVLSRLSVMMWTESGARRLPRASLMMLRLRARRPPDNLTPVGSKKLCFSPRSNFPESEWRSYSRFTNERKSLCFHSQSDFDLHRANSTGILGALGADVAQRQNTRWAPETLHLIYFGSLKTHWRAKQLWECLSFLGKMLLMMSEILSPEVSLVC